MERNYQWLLRSRPVGLPQGGDFTWVEAALEPLADGQVRLRNIYLSLDPANRGWMARDTYVPAVPLGTVMRGLTLSVVEESRHAGFQVGDKVQGLLGWQKYATSDGKGLSKLPPLPIPLLAHFGMLGHIGLTAYFGLLDIGQPKAGETLVVSAAAGAVGSLVGQIGKIHGCRVVGIAGSEEKCRWLTETLGFDAAINYKTEALGEALRAKCPAGIDVYFENVGGPTLQAVLEHCNIHARIAVCGMISGYNETEAVPGPRNLSQLIVRRIKMQGFLVSDFLPRAAGAVKDLVTWHLEGRLQYRLDVVRGLENTPAAFQKLFSGANTGKLVVQISPE